ncbi:MAG: nucleotidyltransferase domain-containing protein [Nitrospinae bacterium]|nr:nucleotidyltransferase domain-containing protein [Nitrospinota bacterium]
MNARRSIKQKDELIHTIVDVVNAYLHPKRIILFGSRVTGKDKEYSDFDIAVEGAEIDIRSERRLKETLDEKLGIFTVDVINLDKVDKDFKVLVLEKGRVIYGQ